MTMAQGALAFRAAWTTEDAFMRSHRAIIIRKAVWLIKPDGRVADA